MGTVLGNGGCGIIEIVIGIWYWGLVLIAVYHKAYHMGINATLWMFAALVFNLAALVVLYLYAMLKGTCTNCGRVKNGSGKFCDRCGNILKKECPQCRQQIYHLPIAATVVKNWIKKKNKEFCVNTVDNDLYKFYKRKYVKETCSREGNRDDCLPHCRF